MVPAVTSSLPGAQDPAARSQELAGREGSLPCTTDGCLAATGIACEYVDLR
jgi:hypothetical protein